MQKAPHSLGGWGQPPLPFKSAYNKHWADPTLNTPWRGDAASAIVSAMNAMELASPVLSWAIPHRSTDRPIARPKAVQSVDHNALACVCAWCADKREADAWCLAEGFDTTHTICPTCRVRFMGDYERSSGGGWLEQELRCLIAE